MQAQLAVPEAIALVLAWALSGSLLFGGMACLRNGHPNRFVGFVHIGFLSFRDGFWGSPMSSGVWRAKF
jgi:hypothetical protein